MENKNDVSMPPSIAEPLPPGTVLDTAPSRADLASRPWLMSYSIVAAWLGAVLALVASILMIYNGDALGSLGVIGAGCFALSAGFSLRKMRSLEKKLASERANNVILNEVVGRKQEEYSVLESSYNELSEAHASVVASYNELISAIEAARASIAAEKGTKSPKKKSSGRPRKSRVEDGDGDGETD